MIGVYDDLIQMYDTYFLDKFQEKVSNPFYRKMVQQIVEKSRNYITGNKRFRGRYYTNDDASKLQITIMKVNRESLEKIKN